MGWGARTKESAPVRSFRNKILKYCCLSFVYNKDDLHEIPDGLHILFSEIFPIFTNFRGSF